MKDISALFQTADWKKEKHAYYLEDSYECHDRINAFERSLETSRLPLGIFYVNESQPIFEEIKSTHMNSGEPASRRAENPHDKIFEIMAEKR